jgi:putative CocE/NonD family hydrolase
MFQVIQAAGWPSQHLIVGPWSHNTLGQDTTGQFTFPNAAMDINANMEEWFSHYLFDTSNGVPNWPAIQYYVMGDVAAAGAPGNEWRTASAWPPGTATDQTLYLHDDGTLNDTAPGAGEAYESYAYDPTNPVPTVGGNNMIEPLGDGPYDQTGIEGRSDVLTYTTEVLSSALEVTGTIRASIWIQADVSDTDVSVRVTDVYPDGRSVLITEGITRARFRNGSFASETLMTPNTPYQIHVELWPTSIVFNAGHRIRIAVTSSNSPRFAPNPNTGAAFQLNDTTTQVANIHILHDAAQPSAVVFPTYP